MVKSADVVVVGSGINGMVAAAELALAGWSVTIVEERDRLGGFIASEELTLPGFVHDTFSSWHPLFMAGPAHAVLGHHLSDRGLEYCNTDGAVTASVSGENGAVIAYRDPGRTAEHFALTKDRAAYLQMMTQFASDAPHIFGAMGAELNPSGMGRLGWQVWRDRKLSGASLLARAAVQSGRGFVREHFDGWEADQLWSPWLLHAGLSPDHASGGLMFPVMAATMHGFGLPVVAGGAGQFVQAFAQLFADLDVTVLLGTRVDSIVLEGGRARGVRTDAGTITADRAVLASASPAELYQRLLPEHAVPETVRQQVARFRPGRAAMQIHLALSRPPSWHDPQLDEVPLIHVSNGAGSTAVACAEAEAGLLPGSPTVVVGQQFLLDPSRVPSGRGSLWIQLQEVPFTPTGDSLGQIDTSDGWTPQVVEGYVSRVIDRLEEHCPGLRSTIEATAVLTPQDLQSANRNAVAGDPYGGSAELDQNLVWRPVPAASRHDTAIPGLWHIGASTHPGPGLAGGSGHTTAQRLLAPPKRFSFVRSH